MSRLAVLAVGVALVVVSLGDAPVTAAGSWHRVRATWYGPGFYGNRTACGHRMSRTLRGVAHRTLPCGTRIELRWHGRRVITRVVDRGPYPSKRSPWDIDLTARTSCWDLMGGRYKPCFTKSGVRWRTLGRR